MRTRFLATALAMAAAVTTSSADRMLTSNGLSPCQDNNQLTVDSFDVSYFATNNSLHYALELESTITGYLSIDVVATAYGFTIKKETINPCTENLTSFCPASAQKVQFEPSNTQIKGIDLSAVPSIAYTIPDLDANVKIYFRNNETGESLACLSANLSNGQTVEQIGVSWALAVVIVLVLFLAAFTGSPSLVFVDAFFLITYFQARASLPAAQAFIGLLAIDLPPIVSAWTQNLQFTLGLIGVGFVQSIATWYQRSTGGTASTILVSAGQVSNVIIQKRNLLQSLSIPSLSRRDTSSSTTTTVTGVQRAGYLADIEPTNVFMTAYIFVIIAFLIGSLGVILYKGIAILIDKNSKDAQRRYTRTWTDVSLQVALRLILLVFPPMAALCFWEMTSRDSAAEVVLAVFVIISILGILSWSCFKVIDAVGFSRKSELDLARTLHFNPAMSKWSFLFAPFRPGTYFFFVPYLAYILIKSLFVAFGQGSGVAQAVCFLVADLVFFIALIAFRPFHSKKANGVMISMAVINAVNSILLLLFSNVFNQAAIVNGVCGVVFFVINVIYSAVMLIILIVALIFAFVNKNVEEYKPMESVRSSFAPKSTTDVTEMQTFAPYYHNDSHDGSYKPTPRKPAPNTAPNWNRVGTGY